MIAPDDPSQLAPFRQTTTTAERPAKRRGVDEDEAIEVVTSDEDESGGVDIPGGTLWNNDKDETRGKEVPESVCEFTSIRELRKECRKRASPGEISIAHVAADRIDLGEILTKHAFVGIADRQMGLSLIQHSTKLFLVNHATLGYVIDKLGPVKLSAVTSISISLVCANLGHSIGYAWIRRLRSRNCWLLR